MAYNGRRGPNVSEYIANLNAVPTAQEVQDSQDYSTLDEDLALFTNTQFYDFDLGAQDVDLPISGFGQDAPAGGSDAPDSLEIKPMEFLQGDFNFPDFNFQVPQTYGNDGLPQQPAPLQTAQPIYAASAASPTSVISPSTGEKRKASSTPDSYEDASRLAAEEDKRRRNTAASARFRVKKKQREQALERSAKDMSDKMAALEGKISQLETENKWLKNLITEKHENKEDIADLWKKFSAENPQRITSERKDGVGTKE